MLIKDLLPDIFVYTDIDTYESIKDLDTFIFGYTIHNKPINWFVHILIRYHTEIKTFTDVFDVKHVTNYWVAVYLIMELRVNSAELYKFVDSKKLNLEILNNNPCIILDFLKLKYNHYYLIKFAVETAPELLMNMEINRVDFKENLEEIYTIALKKMPNINYNLRNQELAIKIIKLYFPKYVLY